MRTSVFIDESIQGEFGFIASALVFDQGRIAHLVEDGLRSAGLEPGRDEFKSGQRMAGNHILQTLRDQLLGIAGSQVRLAVVFTSSSERVTLGRDILVHLVLVCQRNGIQLQSLRAYFDEGIFSSVEQARRIAIEIPELGSADLNFEQDSKKVLGIQVADVVAHAIGQVLKQNLSQNVKTILLGEDEGYPEGTPTDLGSSLLTGFRYTLFHRWVVYESKRDSVDPLREPRVISGEEDVVDYAQHPDLYGWGVFVAPSVPQAVRCAVEALFAKIWLGCIH